ncbi:MAG: S8/S53 family peptidase [Candidatus Sericytochromatia bacterium]
MTLRFLQTILLIFILLTSCLPANISNINTQIKSKSINDVLMGTPKANPYYGEIDLKIDTSLANANKESSRQFSLVQDENTFNIQSSKDSDIVYSKNIKLNGQEQIINESFNISDTTKKYTILVTKTKLDDNIEIKINDIQQINNIDFDNSKYKANKETILESNNNISIKANGKLNGSINITIFESSKIETVRKQIQNIKWKEISQNSNQQMFYPDTLSSLGNLKPYEGDIIDPSNPDVSIGVSTANDTKAIFTNGYVAVTLREPAQQNLDLLKNRLNATVDSFKDYDGNKIAILKINYEQTNLSNLYNNFKELNTFSQAPIKEATFSSVNSAKTIATFINLLVNHSDLISNAGLLTMLQQNGISISPDRNNNIVTDESQSGSLYKTYSNVYYNDKLEGDVLPKPIPKTSKESWWLTDTNITKAWKYTLGQNTNVGVFDVGFSALGGGYLIQQLNIKNFSNITLSPVDFVSKLQGFGCPDFGANLTDICKDFLGNELAHGYKISSLIASDIDDNHGNSGISPRSKLSLFTYENPNESALITKNLSGIRDLMYSLSNHKEEIKEKNNIDIINISSGTFLSLYSYQDIKNKEKSFCLDKRLVYDSNNINEKSFYICDTLAIQTEKYIYDLSNVKKLPDGSPNPFYEPLNRSIVFVVAGGNENKRVSIKDNQFHFPSSFHNVISVGAYEIENINNILSKIRADFSPKITATEGIGALSSNYGEIDIWAPGDNIAIKMKNDNTWENAGGTSFASPIVAGVAALMKSIDPSLDVNDVRDILQKTGKKFEDESTFKSTNPRYIDAEAAVQEVFIRNGKSPDNYLFKTLKGKYYYSSVSNDNYIKIDNNEYFYTTPKNINLYKNLDEKEVIAYGWFRENNIFDVLQMFEKKQNLTYGTQSIPVIQPYAQSNVVGGDKFAIQINEELKSKLSRVWVGLGDRRVNLLDVVNDYAIYGVDSTIPDSVYPVIMKYLDTGENILTFEQALNKTAIAIGLKPQVPVTFPNGTTLQTTSFISNNSKLQVKTGDNVGISLRGDLARVTIGLGDRHVTLESIVNDYVTFKIPPDLPLGVQDVIIKHAGGGTITIKDALEILASGVAVQTAFPKSITVDGVTTNLDYGYIFAPQFEGDYKDYSDNNLAGVKMIRRNDFDNLAQWVRDENRWGVDFSNSPYSAIEVPDGNYEFGQNYTTLAIVKLKNDDIFDINSNNGAIFSKWYHNRFDQHSKFNLFDKKKLLILNTNQNKSPSTGEVYYRYKSVSDVTEWNNRFIISESLNTLANIGVLVKNQTKYDTQFTRETVYDTDTITSVTNGIGRMYLGNFVPEQDYGGLLWDYRNNLKGNLYGFAIIKQSLNEKQIKEVHRLLGY